MKRVFLLLAMIPVALWASENQLQEDIGTFKKITNYFSDTQLYAGLGLGTRNDYAHASDNSMFLSVGVSLPLPKDFSLGLNIRGSSQNGEEEEETARDKNITDANGTIHRLVERNVTYKYNEDTFVNYLLEYRIKFNNKSILVPYVGYGINRGEVSYSEYSMTDRKEPELFSKHNRYELFSKTQFEKTNYIFGARFHHTSKYYVGVEGMVSSYKLRKTARSSDSYRSSEEFAYRSDAYNFEEVSDTKKIPTEVQGVVTVGVFF